MKTSFNREIAMDFLICLGRMITLRREVDGIPFREAAFTVAEAGNEHGFEQAVKEANKDLIVLAFKPGKERRGPANIAVYETYDGKVKTWPRCSVWVLSREGPALIVPKGADFGFAYHDAALCRVGIVPVLPRLGRIAWGKSRNDTRMAARHSAQCLDLGGLGAQPDRGLLAIAKLAREPLQSVALIRSADFAHARFA